VISDFEVLGIFDILVNGVLVHSRKCDSHDYGQPGHKLLHNNGDRQMAVWVAIEAALSSAKRVCPDTAKEYTFAEYSEAFSKEYSQQKLDGYWSHCMKPSQQTTSSDRDQATVIIRHSSGTNVKLSEDMIRSWFHSPLLAIDTISDDSSTWNFEIAVNGVLVHSRNRLYQGVLHEDEWDQQNLVWKAIRGVLDVDAYAGA